MAKTPKRPRDPNQLAKFITEIATGERVENSEPPSEMAEIGRKGGNVGGKARADALLPERRAEIARKAAAARWTKD